MAGQFNYKKYQMRSDDYYRMLRDQNYSCAICNEKVKEGERLVIDHDHQEANKDNSACRGLKVESG